MQRVLSYELIDRLPANDQQVVASRRDMLRLNRLMGHPAAAREFLREAWGSGARTIADLGAGDGRFLLHVARQISREGVRFDGFLLDTRPSIDGRLLAEFQRIGWGMKPVTGDVLEWLESLPPGGTDVVIATLFLHHLTEDQLSRLFALAADRVNLLMACEPSRSPLALMAAGCVGLIGCNAVTRHDAPVSVRAGFAGRELGELWPRASDWEIEERRLGLLSHLFVARRKRSML